MRRRDFLKQSAVGAALSVLGSKAYSATAEPSARVVLVKTDDRAGGIEAALKQLSFPSPKGKRVLIKPNFNTADPTPGSTHTDTLRRLAVEMKARGASGLAIGDSCGPGNTKEVMEKKGIPALAKELGLDVINFEELPPDAWVPCTPPGSHWKNGFSIALDGEPFDLEIEDERTRQFASAGRAKAVAEGRLSIRAPMPGMVAQVDVGEGESVEEGHRLLVLEAMKMENDITAPSPGVVKEILVEPGTAVAGGQALLVLE